MIVGLHGRMHSGKNEAATRLALLSDGPVVELTVVEVSFAAKLKLCAAAVLGCTVSELEEWKNDEDVCVSLGNFRRDKNVVAWAGSAQTIRSFLQRLGSDGLRDVFGEDIHLDGALSLYRDYSDALYVVTDVRFVNEAQRVRDLGGVVVAIYGPEGDTGEHRSEQMLDSDHVDLFLDNSVRDDDFANLDRQLESLLRFVAERQAQATV